MKQTYTMGLRKREAGLLVALPLLVILFSLGIGAFYIAPDHVAQILVSTVTGDGLANIAPIERSMILDVRLPRVLGAVLAGCGLAVAGGVFQALFGNPLASPYTLGVSNGAGFGAALAIVLSLPFGMIQGAALFFGILSMGLAFLLAGKRVHTNVTIILSGMLVSAFFVSLVALLKFTADSGEKLPQIVYWLMGSLASVGYARLLPVLPPFLIALTVLFLYRWRINILSMGTMEARSMGINVSQDRTIVIIAATFLTALIVSIAGIIGWVGIVIPHFARMLAGPDFRRFMPVAASIGICYLLVIDDLCRTLTSLEIPIGVITGIISIPLFIYFILRKKVSWG